MTMATISAATTTTKEKPQKQQEQLHESNNKNSKEIRTMKTIIDHKNNDNKKLCTVCGDHARGINFNVLTCQPCKAFFRRNALRNHKVII